MSTLKIKKIEAAMRKQGVSQADLARSIETTPSHVNHILKGRRSPSIEALKAICKTLNISAEELLA